MSGAMPGNERWAAGFWTFPGGGGVPLAQAVADNVADAISDHQGDFTGTMSTTTTMARVDTYGYTGGNGAASQGSASLGNVPGTGPQFHPNQICCCVTMRTATLGRRGRGRLYWPATGIPMQTNGQANFSPVDTLVNAFATLFSRVHAVQVSEMDSVHRDMTSVDADYVMDDQRGRKKSLPATRHRAPIQYL